MESTVPVSVAVASRGARSLQERKSEQAAVAAYELAAVSTMVEEYVHLVAHLSGEVLQVRRIMIGVDRGWILVGDDEPIEVRVVIDLIIRGVECTAYGMTPQEAIDDLVDNLDAIGLLRGFIRAKGASDDVVDRCDQVELVDNEELLVRSGVPDLLERVEDPPHPLKITRIARLGDA